MYIQLRDQPHVAIIYNNDKQFSEKKGKESGPATHLPPCARACILDRTKHLTYRVFRSREYLRGGEGGVDWAELDVRVGDGGAWGVGLDVVRYARGDSASTTGSAGGGVGGGVGGVEPEHVGVVVVPYGHDEGHTGTEGRAHGAESTVGLE